MGLEEYREGLLYHANFNEIFTAIAVRLKKQEYFQKWEKEGQDIIKKYPVIEDVLKHGEGGISLSEEEHGALIRYLELRDKMESAERQECYYVGQVHANEHYIDLLKRMDSASESGRNKEKVVVRFDSLDVLQWNHEEQPEFLVDFIQQLECSRDERLKKNPGYVKLADEERMILKKNPFLKSFLEAETPAKKRMLTAVQQQAMVDLVAVYRNKASYEELEMLELGMKLCMELLYVLFK